MRRAHRRDDNEAPIVQALRKAGAFVHYLDGKDTPDLLVGFNGKLSVLEVKNGKGKLRPGQAMFFAELLLRGCPAHVVRDPEGALNAVGINTEGKP
jgi:hypothetical protein